MWYTLILDLLMKFGKSLLPFWKQILIGLVITIALGYVHHLRSDNAALTAANATLTANNIVFKANETKYLKTIGEQNGSILTLKKLSDDQAAKLKLQTGLIATEQTAYNANLATLRAEVYPQSCTGVMDLLLVKAVEKNAHE